MIDRTAPMPHRNTVLGLLSALITTADLLTWHTKIICVWLAAFEGSANSTETVGLISIHSYSLYRRHEIQKHRWRLAWFLGLYFVTFFPCRFHSFLRYVALVRLTRSPGSLDRTGPLWKTRYCASVRRKCICFFEVVWRAAASRTVFIKTGEENMNDVTNSAFTLNNDTKNVLKNGSRCVHCLHAITNLHEMFLWKQEAIRCRC